jgi:SAM-dependent methyltransferase
VDKDNITKGFEQFIPKIFVVETVLGCDIKCPECAVGGDIITRKRGLMTFEQFKIIADKIRPFCQYLYLHCWGEPLLNKDIFRIIQYASTFTKTNIHTNGISLTEESAEQLITSGVTDVSVSIDGMSQEIYQQYRVGGSLDKALESVRMLNYFNLKYGKKVNLSAQFVVFKHNQHQVELFRQFCQSLDLKACFKAPYLRCNSRFENSDDPKYVRSRFSDIVSLHQAMSECDSPRKVFTILLDGTCVMCCYDHNGITNYGNICRQDVLEIWNSPAYRKDRFDIITGNAPKYCVENCLGWTLCSPASNDNSESCGNIQSDDGRQINLVAQKQKSYENLSWHLSFSNVRKEDAKFKNSMGIDKMSTGQKEQGIVKVNVGYGSPRDGFINIGCRNADLNISDCGSKLPFEVNSVDFIYVSDFIEHLDDNRLWKFSDEIFRILKRGGRLRLAVRLNCVNRPAVHLYDFESVKSVLRSIGFVNIRKVLFDGAEDNCNEGIFFVEAEKFTAGLNPNTPEYMDVVWEGRKFGAAFKEPKRIELYKYVASLCRGPKVLDLGCGDGELLSYVNGDVEKYGIDFSKVAIEKALRRQIGHFEVGDIRKLPYQSESFDTVVLMEVIEHLDDVDDVILQAIRVMKKDGCLIITVPNQECLSDEKWPGGVNLHLSTWSDEKLKNLADRFNLVIEKLDEFGSNLVLVCGFESPDRNRLVEILRSRVKTMPQPEPTGDSEAEKAWIDYRIRLRKAILEDDASDFMNWEVIKSFIYLNTSPKEFKSLKNLPSWGKFEKALGESLVGRPKLFPDYPLSSGNLIHQAYNLSQLMEIGNCPVEDLPQIVEFGGGFGTMCKLVHQLGFKGRYIIFDLPECSALQEYYLNAVGLQTEIKIDQITDSKQCIVLLSDVKQLKQQLEISAGSFAFIAVWSISETPIDVRNRIFDLVSGADYYLIAYQNYFRDVTNTDYFVRLSAKKSQLRWYNYPIGHFAEHNYLIGTKTSDIAETEAERVRRNMLIETVAKKPEDKIADAIQNYLKEGISRMKAGNIAESLNLFGKAMSFRKEVPNLHFAMATAYVQLGKLYSAKKECEEELKLQPGHKGVKELFERIEGAINEYERIKSVS